MGLKLFGFAFGAEIARLAKLLLHVAHHTPEREGRETAVLGDDAGDVLDAGRDAIEPFGQPQAVQKHLRILPDHRG